MDEQNTTPEFITEKLKEYNVADAEIAKLADKFLKLKINGLEDTDGYDLVKASAKQMMTLRTTVEKKRKELKADFLNGGRMVDGEANRIQVQIEPIEKQLVAKYTAIDKERAAKELADKLKGLLPMRLEKLATIELVVPEEELNQMDEPKFFVFFNEKQAAYLAAQEEKQAAAGRKLQEEREALEQEKLAHAAEKQRDADLKAAREQATKDEQEKQELERKNNEKLKREAEEERLREAAAAPEKEKLMGFVKQLDNLYWPKMETPAGEILMGEALALICKIQKHVTTKAENL